MSSDLNTSGVVDVWREEGGCKELVIPCNQTLFFGSLLIVLQAADGLLTSLGVSRFGIAAEGNPFLRYLMNQFGHLETLALAKLFAILCVFQLMRAALEFKWMKRVLGFVSCVYICAAVVPWIYILFVRANV